MSDTPATGNGDEQSGEASLVPQAEDSGEQSVRIRRGQVDSLRLYENTDYELDTLERGTSSNLFLNFGIALLSISSSFFIALLTTEIPSVAISTTFIAIAAASFGSGAVSLIVWYLTRHSTATLIQKIKNQIPDEELEPNEPVEDV